MKDWKQLQEQYPHFKYDKYWIEELPHEIQFHYEFTIVGLASFHPVWKIQKQYITYFDVEDEIIQKLAFSIGMVELISYWKLTCSPCVDIYPAHLSSKQIAWWKKQYFYGLQEFFYTNQIEMELDAFMQIQTHGNAFQELASSKKLNGCCVPIGGGKDSVVTIELLKKLNMPSKCYIINPRKATLDCKDKACYLDSDCIFVERSLDTTMLELNRQGFLNGHTPFSALVAFSATLFAYMNQLQYVVLSNEDSANESTVLNSDVNHQYSKSFAFEQDFQEYEKTYIQSNVQYFSLLRGWSEYQIAKEFAKHEMYHDVFRSCNVGSKQDIWCGNCPKCLFVYLILSPFLSVDQMQSIFHKNLLEDKNLQDTFEKLIGIQEEKPFECVGSREEINVAICETIQHMQQQHLPLPYLFNYYQTTPLYMVYKDKENPYQQYFNSVHAIPDTFISLVKEGVIDESNH